MLHINKCHPLWFGMIHESTHSNWKQCKKKPKYSRIYWNKIAKNSVCCSWRFISFSRADTNLSIYDKNDQKHSKSDKMTDPKSKQSKVKPSNANNTNTVVNVLLLLLLPLLLCVRSHHIFLSSHTILEQLSESSVFWQLSFVELRLTLQTTHSFWRYRNKTVGNFLVFGAIDQWVHCYTATD